MSEVAANAALLALVPGIKPIKYSQWRDENCGAQDDNQDIVQHLASLAASRAFESRCLGIVRDTRPAAMSAVGATDGAIGGQVSHAHAIQRLSLIDQYLSLLPAVRLPA